MKRDEKTSIHMENHTSPKHAQQHMNNDKDLKHFLTCNTKFSLGSSTSWILCSWGKMHIGEDSGPFRTQSILMVRSILPFNIFIYLT